MLQLAFHRANHIHTHGDFLLMYMEYIQKHKTWFDQIQVTKTVAITKDIVWIGLEESPEGCRASSEVGRGR